MKYASTLATILMTATFLLFGPGAGTASAGPTTIEQYRGLAIAMGSAGTGKKSTVDVGIFRWSTEEERANFLKILQEQGSAALYKALASSEQVAFMKVSGSLGYKLRFAREFKDPETGKRHLILAAERPITYAEQRGSSRTEEYPFTIIELLLDEEGKGEGALALGIAIGWDKEKDTLALKTYSSEPMRIMNVTKVK